MIRAVFDTNTIVSAILAPKGIPAHLLAAFRESGFELISGHAIVEEAIRTLLTRRIQQRYTVTPVDIEGVRALLEREATHVSVTAEVPRVATHPEDDLILATADSADADHLVTGDHQLQRLGTYKGVRIVSPRQFLEILEREGAE